MKLHAALCFLVFAGCATTQSTQAKALAEAAEGGGGRAGSVVEESAPPVRLETPAGTFLVSPRHAEDFAKALAGEATPTHFYAGTDTP
jgi:hypothetical protein